MTVTKEHVDRAKAEFLKNDMLAFSCVIYQMCVEAGIPIDSCGLYMMIIKDGREIPLASSAQRVTKLLSDDWDKAIGWEVLLPEIAA